MRTFEPPLVRSSCEACGQRFHGGGQVVEDADGRIVHLHCATQAPPCSR